MRDPENPGEIALAHMVAELPVEYAVLHTFLGIPVDELSYREACVVARCIEEQRLSDQMVGEARAKIYRDARRPWWRFWVISVKEALLGNVLVAAFGVACIFGLAWLSVDVITEGHDKLDATRVALQVSWDAHHETRADLAACLKINEPTNYEVPNDEE